MCDTQLTENLIINLHLLCGGNPGEIENLEKRKIFLDFQCCDKWGIFPILGILKAKLGTKILTWEIPNLSK